MIESPKAGGKGKLDKKKIIHILPVQLTPDEVKKKTKHLLQHLEEIDQLDSEAKRVAKHNKDIIAGHQADVRELRLVLAEGSERRDVKCEEVYDWTAGTVDTVRLDTNEKVKELGTRKISAIERQTHLPAGEQKS